jgi:hypothetical protein
MKSKFVGVVLSVLSAFFLVLLPAVPAAAQGKKTQPMVFRNPEVSLPIHSDISRPLRDMAKEVEAEPGFHEENPVRYPKLELLQEAARRGLQPTADGALQTSYGPQVGASIGLNLLGVGNGFPGYSVPDAPTDVNLSVGDTQVVQWVNVSYAVFNKTTGAVVAGPIEGNALWAGFGGPCQTNNDGDIIVLFDKVAHRWLMAQNVLHLHCRLDNRRRHWDVLPLPIPRRRNSERKRLPRLPEVGHLARRLLSTQQRLRRSEQFSIGALCV